MGQKNIVSVPCNALQLCFNGFYRDFDRYELDFGSVTFQKNLSAEPIPVIVYYETQTGSYHVAPLPPSMPGRELE